MVIVPPVTARPLSEPSPANKGRPVVNVPRGALMKPQPLQLMPLGLATTTCAARPATSMAPFNWLGVVEVTSLRISDAAWPMPRLALPPM